MKHSVCSFLLSLFLLLGLTSRGYSQDHPAEKYGDIFYKIERDFQQGNISLDQKILYKLYASENSRKLPETYQIEEETIIKCGTPAISDYQNHKSELSPATISEAEFLLHSQQPDLPETFLSESGRFQIHYEANPDSAHAVPLQDENENDIPDYVEQVAAAADSSYQHEVQNLGYTNPFTNNPLITNSSIDVYILNLEGIYGQSNGASIEIENDFSEGFPPNDDPEGDQTGAIKVTIAHELKHVIQYAANQWNGEVFNWLEMDATLMEEVVYDNVNDYYNYIESEQSIFNSPTESFYPATYYHVTWAIYFEERYGSQFWVDVWEIIEANPFIPMVDAITRNLGSAEAFNRAYIESQLWHFASGPINAVPGFGFQESEHYPHPDISAGQNLYSENFTIPRTSSLDSPPGFAAKYFDVPPENNPTGKLLLEAASQGENDGLGIIAYLDNGSAESSIFSLTESNPGILMPSLDWDNISRVGLVITNSSTTSTGSGDPIFVALGSDEFDITLSQNYPNPFNPTTQIRFTLEEDTHVKLKIFDTAGRLIKTLIDEELTAGLYEPTFDGSGLASGVYFYQLVTNRQQIVKKMTLIK